MTKRIIALLLALIMVFSLVACSSDESDDDDKDEKIEEKEEEKEKDKEDDVDIDPDSDKDDNDKTDEESAEKDDYEERYSKATFENGISVDNIYEKGDIVITPVSYTKLDDPIQNRIELLISNKGSFNPHFRITEVYLDGIRIYASGTSTTVHAGESSSIYATFDPAVLRALDLTDIKELKVNMVYYNELDIETDIPVETESILFERPENGFETHHKSTQALVDRNNIYCAPNYLEFEHSGCYSAYLYVENNNDFNVGLTVTAVKVNGTEVSFTQYGNFGLAPNSKNMFPVEITNSELLWEITEDTEFEFSFSASNVDSSLSLFHDVNDGTFTVASNGKID